MTQSFRISIIALTGATVIGVVPAIAQQYTPESVAAYEECKTSDRNNQILGTVAGGLIGGLIGDKIDDGAGTIIGGAAGAYAGNRIANKDCQKLLRPAYGYATQYGYDPQYVTYDARSGQYIDRRTGQIVAPPQQPTYQYVEPAHREPAYRQPTYTQPQPRYDTQPQYVTDDYGRPVTQTHQPAPAPTAPNGMVRVTDPQTGQVFLVSQADYERYYR